jgi:hypothetical protein
MMEIDVSPDILTAFSIHGDTKPGMWFVFHGRRLRRRVHLTVSTDYQGTVLALPVFILEVPSYNFCIRTSDDGRGFFSW